MRTLSEIRTTLRAHAEGLRERYGMTGLAVFGSVARGEASESSDVDVLVSLERPLGLLRLVNAENYLSGLLGVRVEVVPRREVRPELQERIYREAVSV